MGVLGPIQLIGRRRGEYHLVQDTVKHLLPHEVTERELEMQEAKETEERREEELRVAEVEVEKSLSVEE